MLNSLEVSRYCSKLCVIKDDVPLTNAMDLKISVAKWILKFKEKHKIPNVGVESIVQDLSELFKVIIQD